MKKTGRKSKGLLYRSCIKCGTEFTTTHGAAGIKTCEACRRGTVEKICVDCGGPFTIKKSYDGKYIRCTACKLKRKNEATKNFNKRLKRTIDEELELSGEIKTNPSESIVSLAPFFQSKCARETIFTLNDYNKMMEALNG